MVESIIKLLEEFSFEWIYKIVIRYALQFNYEHVNECYKGSVRLAIL